MTLTEEEAKQFFVDVHKGMYETNTIYDKSSVFGVNSDKIVKWNLFDDV